MPHALVYQMILYNTVQNLNCSYKYCSNTVERGMERIVEFALLWHYGVMNSSSRSVRPFPKGAAGLEMGCQIYV